MTGPRWPRNKVKYEYLTMNCHGPRAKKKKGREWSQLCEKQNFFHKAGNMSFLTKILWVVLLSYLVAVSHPWIIYSFRRKFASWCVFVHRPFPFSNNYSTNPLLSSTCLPIKSRRQRREDGSICVLPASLGHVNEPVHQKRNVCWPVAVISRNRTVKHMAIWRNFCLLNFAAVFAPCLT